MSDQRAYASATWCSCKRNKICFLQFISSANKIIKPTNDKIPDKNGNISISKFHFTRRNFQFHFHDDSPCKNGKR